MDDTQLRELIERARDGDEAAWNRLVKRFQPEILSIAQRLLGKSWNMISPRDVTQEAWLRAKRHLDSYQGAGFEAWLGAIVRNVHHNIVRGKRRQRENRRLPLALHESGDSAMRQRRIDPAVEETPTLRALLERESASRLRAAMATLDSELREILELWMEGTGFSLAAVAERLNLSAKQVRSRFHKGIHQLREKLKDLHP